jgi:FkbM family methyltransferase
MDNHNRFTTIKELLRILDTPLVVFDIGCRWGFQEHWKLLESVVKLIGMDADEQEIQSLNSENQKEEFIPKVLGAQNGYGTLYITKDPACSSLYPPDDVLIQNRPTLDVTSIVSKEKVEISTLDEWTKIKGISKIDFIKLDVQGAELDVLKGTQQRLQSVRMLEVEVQFNPLYKGVPLFGDVDRFLRQRGFSLWRIKNLTHYGLPEISLQSNTEEAVHYDCFSTHFAGKDGQLYWADAFYVHNQIAYKTSRPWKVALQDACMAKVLGFEDLFISSLNNALATCPDEIAQKIRIINGQKLKTDPLSLSTEDKRRIQMTASCADCESISKVPHAGEVFDGPNGRYQLMHNGVKVIENGYYGQWMTELIKRLHGHHEPQEEKAFKEILDYIPKNATMIELGSYWSYYSLWFQNHIANAKNFMIEPDPNNLEVGKINFDLNGMKGYFHHAAIGKESGDPISFRCESDNVIRQVPVISIDDFIAREGIRNVELLLSDIQGFELEMLEGSIKCLKQGIIRFVVISTHHHSISNDFFMHQKCLNFLREHGAYILIEHNIAESYSGDGLIVASFRSEDSSLPTIEVSRNHPENSLFQEIGIDLDDAWAEVERVKSELEMARANRDLALHQINALYNSRSYRLTAPLRSIADFVRKLSKKA